MRVNVYSQELTDEITLVNKRGTNDEGDPEDFYGVRLFLHSPELLHHTPTDDDRSAVTIWLPKSQERRTSLVNTLNMLADMVDNAPGAQIKKREPLANVLGDVVWHELGQTVSAEARAMLLVRLERIVRDRGAS